MSPSAVGSSARASMAAVAQWRDDISGSIVTTGTSTVYLVSSNSGYASFSQLNGQVLAFSPHTTNGATVTLNVDGLGAKPLRSSPGVELQAGTIIQGTPYVAFFNNTDGAFYLRDYFGNPYNTPVGGMLLYMGSTPPNSAFVLPYGQAISRTTYSTLYGLPGVGTAFGAGDGSTTFNVIDIRGKAVAGVDNMGGVSGGFFPGLNLGTVQGSITHTLSTAELPASPLSISGTTSGYTPTVGGQPANGVPNGAAQLSETPSGIGAVFGSNQFGNIAGFSSLSVSGATANMGGGGAHSIVQPTIGVNLLLRII